MKEHVNIYLTSILFLIFSSCYKKEQQVKQNHSEIDFKKGDKINYKIDFPDTVYVSQPYNGILYYKSILDTVTTSFENKEKERYTILYLKLLSKYIYDEFEYENFKKTSKLVFGADDHTKITFKNIKFDSIGTFYINGVILDFVYINLNKKNENGEDLLRLIEKQEEIIHKVVVIPKPALRN
jgi:hypothetical protein